LGCRVERVREEPRPTFGVKGNIMINLDLGTLIDKPVKDVFAFVSNPNNMSKWNSAVVSLQQVTPGAVGVGTKFKSVGEAMGRRIEGEMQVVTYEPDNK